MATRSMPSRCAGSWPADIADAGGVEGRRVWRWRVEVAAVDDRAGPSSRTAVPAAPEPAMPMTWTRSPGATTPLPLRGHAVGQLERGEGRRPLVAVTVVRPGVPLDDGRPVADGGRHVGQPDRLLVAPAVRPGDAGDGDRQAGRPGTLASAPVVIASATSAETAPTRSRRSAGTSEQLLLRRVRVARRCRRGSGRSTSGSG